MVGYIREFLCFAMVAVFCSCTVSNEGLDLSKLDADECEKSGGQFCSIDENGVALELIINSLDPIASVSANGDCDGNLLRDANGDKTDASGVPIHPVDEYCFDVSGVCNEAGLDVASIVARTSLDNYNQARTLGSCQKGKFHVQLRETISDTDKCVLHTLELELIGKKADGSEVTQPAKARKRIGFQVANHEACVGS